MDPVSFAASVTALYSATAKTIKYLIDVKNAPNEQETLLREAVDILPIIGRLDNQVKESRQSGNWNQSLELLATEHGAFDQLREALEKLYKKLKPGKGIKKVVHNLVWTLDKRECEEALKKIERVKSRISLALQDDIQYVRRCKLDCSSAYVVMLDSKLNQAIKADTAGIDKIQERVSKLDVREDGNPDP